MMLMVVKIGRKLGLNTLWRCCKSWRISSHLKTDTYKVSSQVLAFLSWPSILLGFILDNFISKVYGVQSTSLSYAFQHSPCFDTVFFSFFLNLFIFCRDPRGFGFVQFVDPADAAEAKYHMDGQILLGRELTVVFAEENRKKPADMRHRDRGR